MPPKATPIIATISRSQDMQDTSIKNTSSNADGTWFKDTLQQLTINQNAFKTKLNAHNYQPVKMPLIKRFAGDRSKLKKFLTQVKIQINNKRPKLPTPFKKKKRRNVSDKKAI